MEIEWSIEKCALCWVLEFWVPGPRSFITLSEQVTSCVPTQGENDVAITTSEVWWWPGCQDWPWGAGQWLHTLYPKGVVRSGVIQEDTYARKIQSGEQKKCPRWGGHIWAMTEWQCKVAQALGSNLCAFEEVCHLTSCVTLSESCNL